MGWWYYNKGYVLCPLIIVLVLALVVGVPVWLGVGTSGNLEYVKERAEQRFDELDLEVISYEGYVWGFWGYNEYGGAHVWYMLKKKEDNGITYCGALQRWGDEIHLTRFRAYDALKP